MTVFFVALLFGSYPLVVLFQYCLIGSYQKPALFFLCLWLFSLITPKILQFSFNCPCLFGVVIIHRHIYGVVLVAVFNQILGQKTQNLQ